MAKRAKTLRRKKGMPKPTTGRVKVTPLFPGIPKKKKPEPLTPIQMSRQLVIQKVRDFARGTSVMTEVEDALLTHESEVIASRKRPKK